jgi:hypothetical protein
MNTLILQKIKERQDNKELNIIQELKKTILLSDEQLLTLYKKAVSIHQTNNQGNGNFLEESISQLLTEHQIIHMKQITIDKAGIIVSLTKETKKCYHIVDIIIGDVLIGKSIEDYIVISCKTTCRERWLQDNWSLVLKPKLYLLITLSNDYPLSSRFQENEQRKIITCTPKKKDDRIYKLDFDCIIDLISIQRKS